MPINSQRCLTIEELVAYGDQGLTGAKAVHLEECELCRAALDGLALVAPSTKLSLLEGSFMDEFNRPPSTTKEAAKQRTLFPKRWLVAASMVATLGWASWQYFPRTDQPIYVDTSAFAYVEQPYKRQMRSAGITTDMYGEAAQAFARDSFTQSVQLYLSALPSAPTSLLRTRGYYELGIAYWQLGAHTESIDYLTRARLGEMDYYEDATWALAQLYRQLGFLDEAKSLYNDLLTIEKSPYKPKAEEIITIIKSTDNSSY